MASNHLVEDDIEDISDENCYFTSDDESDGDDESDSDDEYFVLSESETEDDDESDQETEMETNMTAEENESYESKDKAISYSPMPLPFARPIASHLYRGHQGKNTILCQNSKRTNELIVFS